MRNQILKYAKEKYQSDPEYLWKNTPDACILRHSENQKWYALMMEISPDKLGLSGNNPIQIMNLKCDPLMLGSFLQMPGYFRAYHMNKNHWMTVLLDGSIKENQLFQLLDMSYQLTTS